MVDFTVAIPTYNGEQRLPEVLQRLQAQIDVESIHWEVVVVDNNSQDQTAAVVKAFQAMFPCPLRYCLELRQGVGSARQRAIQEAHGELIGFIDDDNLPNEDWVAAAYRFAQQHPQAGAYGSRISAQFEVAPAAHFNRILPFLAITERGAQPRLYAASKKLLPPGAGLVIRKQAWLDAVPHLQLLKRFHFNRADGNDCGEDIEALSYLRQAGWEIWYNPAMHLNHKIPAWRLERSYLMPMFRSIGLSRCVTRMVMVQPWQRGFVLIAYGFNDLRRVIMHLIKYHAQLKTDVVAACELELYISSLISPLYFWGKVLASKATKS
jgi:glycosyltransferase involved in cell wall biosynthesis